MWYGFYEMTKEYMHVYLKDQLSLNLQQCANRIRFLINEEICLYLSHSMQVCLRTNNYIANITGSDMFYWHIIYK